MTKEKVYDDIFKERHKKSKVDFTRKRSLGFAEAALITMNYKTKSNALSVYDFTTDILNSESVSRQAYEAARNKISSSAFREIFEDGSQLSLSVEDPETYYGYIVCAVDGSLILLPKSAELKDYYGKTSPVEGRVYARASLCVDVLNGFLLDGLIIVSKLEKEPSLLGFFLKFANVTHTTPDILRCCVCTPFSTGERKLAMNHIKKNMRSSAKDCKGLINLFDRGYWDPKLVAAMVERGQKFVFRLAVNAVPAVTQNEESSGTIKIAHDGSEYTIRYYKFQLQSGETEYLATNVWQDEIPDADIPYLYSLRWGVETKYNELKNRMQIENFSGKTINTVEQDFYASLYAMNLTSFAIAAADAEVREKRAGKNNKYKYKPNGNMAAGILKDRVIRAIVEDDPMIQASLLDKLVADISKNVVPIIPDRHYHRPMSNTLRKKLRRTKCPL